MADLYLGDCLEVMKTLGHASVDVVIADLPYGITSAKWDCEIPLEPMWSEYKRLAKPATTFVLFASQPFTSKLITSNLQWFRYCWYWEKEKGTGFLNAKHQPLRCIEEICIFYKHRGTYNPQMVPCKPYRHKLPTKASETVNEVASFCSEVQYKEYTQNYPKNKMQFARDKANKGMHSTQKPEALLEYLVNTYSNPGDLILDNTMGSGTTGVAAKKLGREFVGIELDPRTFRMAEERIGAVNF